MPLNQKKCFVLDLDGTVYLGDIPIAGTVAFIKRHWRDRDFYFLSNNTSKGLGSYLKKLAGLGIDATADHMLSPTLPMVEYLRLHRIRRVYLLGNDDYTATLLEAMPELELVPTGSKEAEAVVLAYDTELTYSKLVTAGHLLQQPAVRYFATHPDLVCPHPDGGLPDVGSFIALFEKVSGRLPQKIFGKPEPAVLAPLFKRYEPYQMVMVGDRLSTDKKLAENAGIDFILVLSGEATLEDARRETRQPWRILPDLSALE